jgi:hypothetical protein
MGEVNRLRLQDVCFPEEAGGQGYVRLHTYKSKREDEWGGRSR